MVVPIDITISSIGESWLLSLPTSTMTLFQRLVNITKCNMSKTHLLCPTTIMKIAPTTAFPFQSMRASSFQLLRPNSHPSPHFLTPSLICEKILLVWSVPDNHSFSPPLLLLTWSKLPFTMWIISTISKLVSLLPYLTPYTYSHKKPVIFLKYVTSHHFFAQHL